MGSVRDRMSMFEGGGRPSMGGETARLSHVNASSDIARRISILVEAPANRLVATAATAALKAAAEAVTPPPQCAPHHPRGHFLPLHVRTPETSPRGSRLAARDADGTPQAHQKKLWRIASADEPTTPTQQAPLADAASSYEIGAAFRSCEVNSEGTIPVRELGFGLSVLGGGPVASAEPAAILAAAGLQDATRLSLAEFTRCARELTKLRQEAAAAKAIQRRLDEAPARAQPTDENADPFGVAAGAAADAAGAARQSRHSVLGAGGVPKPQPGARPAKELSSQLLRVHGVHAGTAGTVHSFSEEEKAAFASYLSYALADDPDLSGPSGLLPIDPDSLELFEKVRSGVLLCKLVNLAQADAIDERAINTTRRLLRRNAAAEAAAMEAAANGGLPFQPQPAPQLSLFQLTENHNLAICAAKAIGCHVINIDASDMLCGTPHLVLGLIWQLVKMALLSSVNLSAHPGLAVLLHDGEELRELSELSAEHVLLRWLNWHLEQAGRDERVRNFGKDISDSLAYTVLLHRICPDSVGASLAPLLESDLHARAEAVVETAARLGDVAFAISARDIVSGNEKLNLGFVAALFNAAPGLALLSADEAAKLAALKAAEEAAAAEAAAAAAAAAESGRALLMAGEGGSSRVQLRSAAGLAGLGGGAGASAAEKERLLEESREERAFRMWLNSLELSRFVRYLFDDCRDGLVLLQAMDALKPGSVRWRGRVNLRPRTVYETVENGNYAIEVCAAPELPRAEGAAARAAALAEEAAAASACGPRLSVGGGRPWEAGSFSARASYGGAAFGAGYGGALGGGTGPLGGRVLVDGFGLSLVGIGGKDLYDGNRTYILAVIWQLMRYHLLNFIALSFDKAHAKREAKRAARAAAAAESSARLPPLPPSAALAADEDAAETALLSPGGRAAASAAARREAARDAAHARALAPLTEEDVLRWANEAVAASGSARRIESFRERSICTGRFLLDLIGAVEPRSVDQSLIQPVDWDLVRGADPDACALNAKYAISCARKVGCSVFCLWEDVVEVRPKLVFAFIAALMARQLELQLD